MRILWIEDKGEIVSTGIFNQRIFKDFWTKSEVENLTVLKNNNLSEEYKYELQEYSSPLFLAADLEDAWEIIKEEEPFDKIIIDIEFPAEDFDFENKYIKKSFHGETSNFEELINFINQDEYMGFTLAHLIISYYKDKFNWTPRKIKENIVFFSANSLTMEDFSKKIKSSMQKSFMYNPETENIKQFNKNKSSDFLNWLKEDEYSIILDRYINSNASNEFTEIVNNKNSLENIRSLFDTILKIIANEIERKMLMDLLEPFYWPKSSYNYKIKQYSKLSLFKKNGEVNIANFISYLAMNKNSFGFYRYFKDKPAKNFYLNDKLNVNLIIQHALYSITEICNKYENHKDYIDGYTKETVETIHAQLKQVIIWFGQVMEEIDKK